MAIKTFTTGEVLTASDTNTYLANSGLVYVTSTTIGSAVSSVTVSNCFSSTYDNYKIVWSNIDCSTGGVSMYVKIGNAATGYYGSQAYWTYAGATGVNNQNNATSLYCGSSDTTTCSGWFELQGPNTTTYTHMSGMSYGSGASTLNMGALENTTSYTAFTFGPAAGTMTGGTVTVYGYRKA